MVKIKESNDNVTEKYDLQIFWTFEQFGALDQEEQVNEVFLMSVLDSITRWPDGHYTAPLL